jgi:hypothetical protein
MRLLRGYGIELGLVVTLGLAVAFFGYLAVGLLPRSVVDSAFDAERALADVVRQVGFGARATGTQASLETSEWLIQQLTGLGWDVVVQEFSVSDPLKGRNIVAIRTPQTPSAGVAMLATHYDSRLAADEDADPDARTQPAPGANNGASGAAVLLELARTLDVDGGGQTVCLVFLDAEANGGIPGWAPFLGSRQLAAKLSRDVLRCASPRFVVALDQVGAPDARFQPDPATEPWVNQSLWATALEQGFGDRFVAEVAAEAIEGSHTAFSQAYATSLIADRAYPHARTLADTPEMVSAETLAAVGRTLEVWLEQGAPEPSAPEPSAPGTPAAPGSEAPPPAPAAPGTSS